MKLFKTACFLVCSSEQRHGCANFFSVGIQRKLSMQVFKKSLLVFSSITCLTALSGYFFYNSLPNEERLGDAIANANTSSTASSHGFSCITPERFDLAYQVNINVESQLNHQKAYTSQIGFQAQIRKSRHDEALGVAENIVINEGEGNKTINNILFKSEIENVGGYTLFTSFDDLGLPHRHPMQVMSQLLKSLSVGENGASYKFNYDPLKRLYQYRHSAQFVERSNVHFKTADEPVSQWLVTLAEDCLPERLVTSETQDLQGADTVGDIRFTLSAQRIPSFALLMEDQYHLAANSENHWQSKQVLQSAITKPVLNKKDMWATIKKFGENKNAAKLAEAARFMIHNVPSESVVSSLMSNDLADSVKQDLVFGLGISDDPASEQYLLDTLNGFPKNTATDTDIQKVRLMVAMSGNGHSTQETFSAFGNIASDKTQNSNVSTNALINMGALAANMQRRGEFDQSAQHTLTHIIEEQLDGDQSTSAIYALGNARLAGFDTQLLSKLNSTNTRERYAAGMVASKNPQNYDQLIQHLRTETSNLVVNAIVDGMKGQDLSPHQLENLYQLAQQTDSDRREIIQRLLR